MNKYCKSRFIAKRMPTREVKVGTVGVGGNNPIRIQSMTTSLTQDVKATVQQSIKLAEAGCEIVRITAPNKSAAAALKDIREQFSAAGFKDIPLVADIHFLPSAAMVAVEHVEKVRVNPGNYADKKKFAVREYSNTEYDDEIQRLYEAFTPLVKRSKELGRAMRIGTNHGSLSDRIMNRYGDTPLGMVESALEFIRIAESHGYYDIILSMKASNTKVMIEAYRLAVKRMLEENMAYPLHLGVTEAGEGEDGRIKGAIGIGSLLYDGLGDTIRVSLTEDPWYEIPVANDLANRAMELWKQQEEIELSQVNEREEDLDPYEYKKRNIIDLSFGIDCPISTLDPPRAISVSKFPLGESAQVIQSVKETNQQLKDVAIEGLMVPVETADELQDLNVVTTNLRDEIKTLILRTNKAIGPQDIAKLSTPENVRLGIFPTFDAEDLETIQEWIDACSSIDAMTVIDLPAADIDAKAEIFAKTPADRLIFTNSRIRTNSITESTADKTHAVGAYRALADTLKRHAIKSPLWIRVCKDTEILPEEQGFGRALLEASMFTGNCFVDGFGDLLSVENFDDLTRSTALTYNILQGARMRSVKTEFVACPSCGRTLFDLQEVTQRIKERTGHLKGVTIAVMGCIVNGPGEMADADFGYVGGAPEKINLYVGKECVKYNIPENEALDRLVDLIKEHNKWVEPTAAEAVTA